MKSRLNLRSIGSRNNGGEQVMLCQYTLADRIAGDSAI